LLADRVDEARGLAQDALRLAEAHEEIGCRAWVLRLLGDIAARGGPPGVEEAGAHFREALTLARSRGMRLSFAKTASARLANVPAGLTGSRGWRLHEAEVVRVVLRQDPIRSPAGTSDIGRVEGRRDRRAGHGQTRTDGERGATAGTGPLDSRSVVVRTAVLDYATWRM